MGINFFSASTTASAFIASVGSAIGAQVDNTYLLIAALLAIPLFFWFWHSIKENVPGHSSGRIEYLDNDINASVYHSQLESDNIDASLHIPYRDEEI